MAKDSQLEVIAIYSLRKVFPVLLILLLLFAIILWGWFDALADPDGFDLTVYRTYFLFFGSVLYLLYTPRFLILFRQVLFKKRQAVWIDDGCLIYLDRKFFCVPCSNISSISLDVYGPYNQEGICILKKDGETKTLPMGTLSGSAESIFSHLKSACLPGEADQHFLGDDVPGLRYPSGRP